MSYILDEALESLKSLTEAADYSKTIFNTKDGYYVVQNGQLVKLPTGGKGGQGGKGGFPIPKQDQQDQQGGGGKGDQQGKDKGKDKGKNGADKGKGGDKNKDQQDNKNKKGFGQYDPLIKELEDLLREREILEDALGTEKYSGGKDSQDIAQDILDKANDAQNPSGNPDKDSDNTSSSGKSRDDVLKEEIEKLKKQVDDLKKEYKEKTGQDFGETDEERKERLKRIDDYINDPQIKHDAIKSADKAVERDREQRRAAEYAAKERAARSNLSNAEVINILESDLRDMLTTRPTYGRSPSWIKPNKNYMGSNIVKQGRRTQEVTQLPVLSVYYDRSASWDKAKTKFGDQAIAAISDLQNRNKLQFRLKYFNDAIHVSTEDPGDGDNCTKPDWVFEDIQKDDPENVMIITDDDFEHQGIDRMPYVQVQGAVFLIFKPNVSPGLCKKLTGRLGTRVYQVNTEPSDFKD